MPVAQTTVSLPGSRSPSHSRIQADKGPATLKRPTEHDRAEKADEGIFQHRVRMRRGGSPMSQARGGQFGDGLNQTAIALQAYEKSAGRCAYEPIVGQALNRLRDHYAETEPYRWQRSLRESTDADDIMGNVTAFALQGSPYTVNPNVSGPPKPAAPRDSKCVGSGLAVGAALPFAAPLIGFDQTLFAEANRLMDGKGRIRTGTSATPGPRSDLNSGTLEAPNAVASSASRPNADGGAIWLITRGRGAQLHQLWRSWPRGAVGGGPCEVATQSCGLFSRRASCATGSGHGLPARMSLMAASSAECRRSRRRH